jgi:RNA polymerase sigma factor (sigma-70 family)
VPHPPLDPEPIPDGWSHRGNLIAYAARLLGSTGAAEDIVQEAYLRLLRETAAGRAPRETRPWLFRVVRNLAIEERRRACRTTAAPPELACGVSEEPPLVVERRHEAAMALRLMAGLPPVERRAIELEQAGVSAQGIANETGSTSNAVHQALFRGRRRMRQARAAAWGLIPAPIARLLQRASETPAVTMAADPATTSGRALRITGALGATLVGIIGGGAALHEATTSRPEAPNAAVAAARPAALAAHAHLAALMPAPGPRRPAWRPAAGGALLARIARASPAAGTAPSGRHALRSVVSVGTVLHPRAVRARPVAAPAVLPAPAPAGVQVAAPLLAPAVAAQGAPVAAAVDAVAVAPAAARPATRPSRTWSTSRPSRPAPPPSAGTAEGPTSAGNAGRSSQPAGGTTTTGATTTGTTTSGTTTAPPADRTTTTGGTGTTTSAGTGGASTGSSAPPGTAGDGSTTAPPDAGSQTTTGPTTTAPPESSTAAPADPGGDAPGSSTTPVEPPVPSGSATAPAPPAEIPAPGT